MMTEIHKSKRGPAYLEGRVVPENPERWIEQEWTGKLCSQAGHAKFHIFYYGELMDDLIAVTEFAPQLVIAENAATGERCNFEEAKRNGFDAISITITSAKGLKTEIIQEELA